jgi:nucleoside-diphosphate-sugar epimerase
LTVLGCWAGGFIGGHLIKELLFRGFDVKGVDLKPLDQWWQIHPIVNLSLDLRDQLTCKYVVDKDITHVFNLACDMGGIGFISKYKADCMTNVLINTNLLLSSLHVKNYFFSSSACVYNQALQSTSNIIYLKEEDAYPANPEDGYGWEKLFSERMCFNFMEDYGLNVRVSRLHNVYGPYGAWDGGREKSISAICRKVILAKKNNIHTIDIWGDGSQIRSFLFIDDCINGIFRILNSNSTEPLNLGSSKPVTINQIVSIIEDIAKIKLNINYDISAPKGVNSRCSDNNRIKKLLNWEPSISLEQGIQETYHWIEEQINK